MNVNMVLSKNEIEEGQRRKYFNVKINGQTVKLLLDSGSDILVRYIFKKKMKYLGQIIDSDGRKPGPERTEAIKNMPAPDKVAKTPAVLGISKLLQHLYPQNV